jgi:hypothetical protein
VKLSEHFILYSLKEREYLTVELCELVIKENVHSELQKDGRIRYWGFVPQYDKYLRVVIEADGETILTAHFDRNFKKNKSNKS